MRIHHCLLSLALLLCSACNWFPSPPEHYLVHPKVHFIFWGATWNAADYEVRWTRLLAAAPGTPAVLDRLAEYGNTGATFVGPAYQPADVPVDTTPGAQLLDATIDATLEDYFRTGQVPAPSGEDVYVVFLPTGTTTVLSATTGAIGYHTASFSANAWYAIAVVTDRGTNDITLSHELYESITDPYGTGWHNGPHKEEVADMCEPGKPTYVAPGYEIWGDTWVSHVWSAAQGKCL